MYSNIFRVYGKLITIKTLQGFHWEKQIHILKFYHLASVYKLSNCKVEKLKMYSTPSVI